MFRCASLLLAVLAGGIHSFSQDLTGRLDLPGGGRRKLVLWSTVGSEHVRHDSVVTDARGRFHFELNGSATGFYQLSLNDSDRVDIILSAREREVDLEIDGLPLQENIHVLKSRENQLLWEYKLASREAQAVNAAIRQERMALAPTEVDRMRALDSIGLVAAQRTREHLARLIEGDPDSYFAKVTGTNLRLERAMQNGRRSVVKGFDFSDPELLRSSVYDNGLAAFLQSDPPRSELDMYRGIDSLMLLSGRDAGCRAYTLGFLVDLFGTYGPDLALQYTVDRYVGSSDQVPARLRARVEELLAVSVGRIGPDVGLSGLDGSMGMLSRLATSNRYVVLFFYSSTCDHCHAQMPVLRDLYERRHADGLEIAGIAIDDDTSAFRNTIEEERLPWPSFSSFDGWGSAVAKAWQVKATPFFYLIDADLRIIAKPFDAAELDRLLNDLMH